MSIVVIIAITVVVAYLTGVGVQYELHRSLARQLRPVPVVTRRPALRLVVDNTRTVHRSGTVSPVVVTPLPASVDHPPSAA